MAASSINNPKRILQTLDSFLERETRIVLFGRAALALGYGDQGVRFGRTQDVDAILPSVEMAKIEADSQFWKAIELTNKSLEPSGLYVSHLFTDRQIALTPGWLGKIVSIPSGDYKSLQLFRPSSLDLILTKMMRNDREDFEDIRFILSQEKIDQRQLDLTFAGMEPLEIPELQRIFTAMQPAVRKLAIEANLAREGNDRPGSVKPTLDPDWWSEYIKPTAAEKEREKDREIER
jgi:hypothetical protein